MRRCLIVANQTLMSPQLGDEVLRRRDAGEYDFHVLVPATHAHGTALWTEGHAVAHAREALGGALTHFRNMGIEATGEVGDADPVLAVHDVVNRQSVDEIIVSTLPPGVSKWMKRDLPHRLERRFGLPVTHVAAIEARVS
jgi:hypothetical protein